MKKEEDGGIPQKRALRVPCLTHRENPERSPGRATNWVVGLPPEQIVGVARRASHGRYPKDVGPSLGNGTADQRVVKILLKQLALDRQIEEADVFEERESLGARVQRNNSLSGRCSGELPSRCP